MIYQTLIKRTNAYKIISSDKKNGSLSHAYLITCADRFALRSYLVELAKVIECESGGGDDCRACRLIDKNAYADCTFYPLDGDKILTADIDDLLSKVYIKPLENATRLFVLVGAENMNASAQNKILKTLEEPPKGVCLLLGATRDYGLLPTVKSRVKKIDIPPFATRDLVEALRAEGLQEERLKWAVSLAGGLAGEALNAYEGSGASESVDLCKDILTNMRSSKDIVKFISRVEKQDMKYFLSAMQIEVMNLLKADEKDRNGFSTGALIAIEEMLTEKQKAVAFNANAVMTVDGVLLSIVEEKHKWQRL